MGQGIDAAREEAPEHTAMLDDLKDQLLVVFLKRIVDDEGNIAIPLKEIDDTGNDLVSFSINEGIFNFKVRKKN